MFSVPIKMKVKKKNKQTKMLGGCYISNSDEVSAVFLDSTLPFPAMINGSSVGTSPS
jgi:hypothetical protein